MKKQFFVLLFFALVVYGQEQKRLAILQTVDDGEPPIELTDLRYLTVTLREIAGNVLQNRYGIMSEQSIIDKLGKDNAAKACKEAEGCLAQLGRKISADYIGQARLGRFDGNLAISVELYNSASGLQVGTIRGDARNVSGLLAVLNEKAPGMFRKMPGISSGKSPSFGGIGDVQTTGGNYELNEKRYLAYLNSDPPGAVLSFDGVPSSNCVKTPCKAELREGSVRIIANLDQYEIADTTVFIKQNNQSIAIALKPNFGFLEIKPAYIDDIGKDKGWSLIINGKGQTSYENKFSPGNYDVKLSHECYEDISFKAGIDKGKREIFDMSSHIVLKKGGLDLSAEIDGEPTSEPVFVNGKQIGETPFIGTVPLCAKVEIGVSREAVDVELEYNKEVKHTHKVLNGIVLKTGILTDGRDGTEYKTIGIGTQNWMAENLNYNANGSKCYDNTDANCDKYGRLYDWNTAMKSCPNGWHLPSKEEWDVLTVAVGGDKHLSDIYVFSAQPGGLGDFKGYFGDIGSSSYWWSALESNNNSAYYLSISHNYKYAYWNSDFKSYLFSIRCLQGEYKPLYVLEPNTPDFEKPVKTSFWVALSLDVVGAAIIGVAIYENNEMNKAYKRYSSNNGSSSYYENTWKQAEDSRNTRNTLYVIGGLVLASGIGVHIWF